MELKNKTILITGGTSGIGQELTYQLMDQDNEVIVLARSEHKLRKLERYARSTGHAAKVYQCDLSRQHQIEQVVDDIVKHHPNISVLINNAAVQFTPTFISDDFDFDSIGFEITTNLTAPMWLTSLLLSGALLQQDEAVIVNMSSGLAFAPKTESAVYCATKAALHNFSQGLRYQLADTPVNVVEVLLPLVETPMTEGRGTGKLAAFDVAFDIIKGIEAGHDEIYLGKARLLPWMMRLAPGLIQNILRRS